MKKLLMFISLLGLCGAAMAAPVPLQTPAGIANTNPYRVSVIGTGFNADDTVHGSTIQLRYYPCSGRGCSPASTGAAYATSWGVDGTVLSVQVCASRAYGNARAPAPWQYMPGFDVASCPTAVSSIGVVVVDGVPYYLYATSADGLYDLVNGGIVTL